MKVMILVSLALTVAAMLLPMLLPGPEPAAAPEDGGAAGPAPDETAVQEKPTPRPGELFYSGGFDRGYTVTLLDDGAVRELTLSDYLFGAVAAEMPAAFEPEALKAQAVALRSYLIYKTVSGPSKSHPDADICSKSSCCAAWRSDDALREKWGEKYDEYAGKLKDAVLATDGLALAYAGEPVLAVFHSSSGGRTESSEEVWSTALPYLVSVESPEDGENIPNYTFQVTVTLNELYETVSKSYPDARKPENAEEAVGSIVRTASGRIRTATLCGVEVPGTTLRKLFSLRSTDVEITAEENAVTMISTGYGHGVGMSQYGANAMAEDGADFAGILENYYPGTELTEAAKMIRNSE